MELEHKTVTVQNLVNSLGQIEIWVKAVRLALQTLDPKTKLKMSPTALATWTATDTSPLRTSRECPPPE